MTRLIRDVYIMACAYISVKLLEWLVAYFAVWHATGKLPIIFWK